MKQVESIRTNDSRAVEEGSKPLSRGMTPVSRIDFKAPLTVLSASTLPTAQHSELK
jgi:hypothetical protein